MALDVARRSVLLGVAGAVALASAARSEEAASAQVLDDKPFAEHRLALQLSDNDAHKQGLILSVANNMLTVYGPDTIAVEVVTFGPGIDLLRSESPHRTAVDSLIAQGVTFDFCLNTIETIERETSKRPEMNAKAKPVQAGVARILALAEKGYTLVRP